MYNIYLIISNNNILPLIQVYFHLNVIYDMICIINENLMDNIFYQAHQLIAFHIPKSQSTLYILYYIF